MGVGPNSNQLAMKNVRKMRRLENGLNLQKGPAIILNQSMVEYVMVSFSEVSCFSDRNSTQNYCKILVMPTGKDEV